MEVHALELKAINIDISKPEHFFEKDISSAMIKFICFIEEQKKSIL